MGLKTMEKIDKGEDKKHVFVEGEFKQSSRYGCCTPGTSYSHVVTLFGPL